MPTNLHAVSPARTVTSLDNKTINGSGRPLIWFDVAVVLLLAVAAARLTVNLQEVIPLWGDDESIYLASGARLGTTAPDPQWGPLYACWYWLLAQFEPDSVARYYLNWRISCAACPVVVYGLARRLGAAIFPATLVAMHALVMAINLFAWPRVTHWAVCWSFAAIGLASLTRDRLVQLAIVAAGLLIAAFHRPEFTAAAALVVAFAIAFLLVRRERPSRAGSLAWAQVALMATALVSTWGFPLKGGRADWAFRSRFTENWKHWTNSPRALWFEEDAMFAEAFGSARTIREAMAANPGLVAKHFALNTRALVVNLVQQVPDHEALVWRSPAGRRGERWLAAVLVAAAFAVSVRGTLARARESVRIHWPAWVAVIAMLVPVVGSVVVIGWASHYVLPLHLLVLVAVAVLIPPWVGRSATYAAPALAAALALAPPRLAPVPPQNDLRPAVMFVREAARTSTIRMLDFGPTISSYLPPSSYVHDARKHPRPFRELLALNPNVIYFEDEVRVPDLVRDDAWHRFLGDPKAFEFREVGVPHGRLFSRVH